MPEPEWWWSTWMMFLFPFSLLSLQKTMPMMNIKVLMELARRNVPLQTMMMSPGTSFKDASFPLPLSSDEDSTEGESLSSMSSDLSSGNEDLSSNEDEDEDEDDALP